MPTNNYLSVSVEMKKYIFFVLLLFLTGCNSQLTPEILTLSVNNLEVDNTGGLYTIHIDYNGKNWKVEDFNLPNWVKINTINTESNNVELNIQPNTTYFLRQTDLKITYNNNEQVLHIVQQGIHNKSSLEWQTFNVNTIIPIEEEGQNFFTTYKLKATDYFINPLMQKRIFHGNLINKQFYYGIDDKDENIKYASNSITISSYTNGSFYIRKDVKPSYEVTKDLFDEINSQSRYQNSTFIYQNNPIQYNSYKHLHILGVGNLGLKLDEIINDKSYKEKELSNRTGLIYNYCQRLFNTTMDLPVNVINDRGDVTKKNFSYISSISYGKMSFLFVETDYDYKSSVCAISKIMKGEPLTQEEECIKESISANYLFFDKLSNVHVIKGFDVIKKYVSDINLQPIIPLSFSINNYQTHSQDSLNLILKF